MELTKLFEEATEGIIRLLKSDNERWIKHKSKLRSLLNLHLQMKKICDLENPTSETLNYIEEIKQFRQNNLNTEENMNDPLYGDQVAMKMSKLKVCVMAKVLKNYF
jgi:hypothetical protein